MDQLEQDNIVDETKLSRLIDERRQEAERLADFAAHVAEQLGAPVKDNGWNSYFRFLEAGLQIEYWPESFRVHIKFQNETVVLEVDHSAIEYHPNAKVTKAIEGYYREAEKVAYEKARKEIIKQTVAKCHNWDIDLKEVLK